MFATYEAVAELNGNLSGSKPSERRKRKQFSNNESVQVFFDIKNRILFFSVLGVERV